MATKPGTPSGVTNPTAFLATALWTGVISAQPSPIVNANLFAPSWQAKKDADAERGLGHDPVVYGSLKDQMDWIGARFAGEPAPNNCAPSNK